MKEKINQIQFKEKFDMNVFRENFPDGEIIEININDVPDKAIGLFESKSKAYIDREKYKPGNFEKFFSLKHPNGDISFIAVQTKDYGGKTGTEESTYLADMRDEELSGYSELRYNLTNKSEYFKDKPFIGFIRTEEDLKKTGLGKRKIMAMNAMAKMLYNKPLYSDTVNSSEMEAVWERLVEKGEAEKFKEGPNDRYVLKRVAKNS